jgi:hypothetical protein
MRSGQESERYRPSLYEQDMANPYTYVQENTPSMDWVVTKFIDTPMRNPKYITKTDSGKRFIATPLILNTTFRNRFGGGYT